MITENDPGPRPGSFSFRTLVIAVTALVVAVTLIATAVVFRDRWQAFQSRQRVDLGPGLIPGTRVVQARDVELGLSCRGVEPDLPVVRLVDQVDIDVITVCLGPGRRTVYDQGGRLVAYRLNRSAGPEAERALDHLAAALSVPDQPPSWWWGDPQDCPPLSLLVPLAMTVDGVTVRAIMPTDPCQQPRTEAYAAIADVAAVATEAW